jgi:hypothetical protein
LTAYSYAATADIRTPELAAMHDSGEYFFLAAMPDPHVTLSSPPDLGELHSMIASAALGHIRVNRVVVARLSGVDVGLDSQTLRLIQTPRRNRHALASGFLKKQAGAAAAAKPPLKTLHGAVPGKRLLA